MNRKDKTKLLSEILISTRFSGPGKYWASEVTFDAFSSNSKRIDFVQFEPKTQSCICDIEKGEFTAYEIKSCKADFNSGHGLNFDVCEWNYIVTDIDTYRDILPELKTKWNKFGVLVAVPNWLDCRSKDALRAEIENPTEFNRNTEWKLYPIIKQHHYHYRNKPLAEMLFCMLRSGQR